MINPLCEFAKSFPTLAADILHRDRHKRRNFREETITDLLTAGLTAFEPFGIYVDFPVDESKTGEDMDWEFVNPHAVDGRRYLRLHIQAKRAIRSKGKFPYWYYRELDHAVPKGAQHGSQHKLLVDGAKAIPGCVALYIFYHTREALITGENGKVDVEGVNLMFADQLAMKLTPGRWPIGEKKVETLRKHFLPLEPFLCSGKDLNFEVVEDEDNQYRLVFNGENIALTPGNVADRLNARRSVLADAGEAQVITSQTIPQETMRAIEIARGRDPRRPRRAEISRPRVIFDGARIPIHFDV